MAIARPKTQVAYIELVNQAMIDAGEWRSTTEDDEELMGGAMGIAESLENNLKALYISLIGGSYQHADEDLEFMEIIKTAQDSGLPFKPLLHLINQTHRQGLETE